MENIILRAMRTFDESVCAPEYARNQLAIEIIFPEPPVFINELAVRVYSEDYQLIGADVYSPSSRKNPRKVRFIALSDTFWDENLYHIFVFQNGLPKWTVSLSPSPSYEVWKKEKLDELESHPDKKFFIERLCPTDWWQNMYSEQFQFPSAEKVIGKLYSYSKAEGVCPHLLVTGNNLMTKAFSCFILAAYLTGNDKSEQAVFSLGELVSGNLQWSELTEHIRQKQVIVMNVPQLEYSASTVNLLSMLGDILSKEDFSRPVFIFHGTEEHVNQLFQECEAIAGMFAEYNTFRISLSTEMPPITLNDTEFQPALRETPFAEFSAEEELQQMVGLKQLKEDIQEARMMSLFLKERRELNLDLCGDSRYHMLFLGNPGTGKTTVARLVGKMYHQMGLLSKGHTVETCRTNLVGEYLGHTEKNTKEAIEEARGGVLFIDEAYTLIEGGSDTKDYGKEVINALLTVLSEPNPDMIVILAGYEDKMKKLLKSNPGLKDRFPLRFHFEDYTADELSEIAHRILKSRDFVLTPEANLRLNSLIEKEAKQRDEHFGNGRWVHNLIEHGLIKSMARRVMSGPRPETAQLQLFSTIEACDVEEAEAKLLRTADLKITPPCRIGFRA